MRYLLICFVAVSLFLGCGDSKTNTQLKDADITQNVIKNYEPSHPITFPHAIHSGELGIQCKYCHNSEKDSKSAVLPSINLCMNCHRALSGAESLKELYEKDNAENLRQVIWEKMDSVDYKYFNPESFQAIEAHQSIKIDTSSLDGLKCASCHY